MPIYEIFTEDTLKEWLSYLKHAYSDLLGSLNEKELTLLAIQLYEYLQCFAWMQGEHTCVPGSKRPSVSIDNITYLISDKSKYAGPANMFARTRNDLCHGNHNRIENILILFTSERFINMLRDINIDDELVELVKQTGYMFSHKDEICKECLAKAQSGIQTLKTSGGTINDLMESLCKEFPEQIVILSIMVQLRNFKIHK